MSLPSSTPFPPIKQWDIRDDTFSREDLNNIVLIKETPFRKVFRSQRFYIKAFRINPLRAILDDPSRREYDIALQLHRQRLTARPAAFCRSGKWSYFAALAIEGTELSVFIERQWKQTDRTEKNILIERFATFIAGIARCGVFQPDIHLNNIIYDERQKRFFLIDLHRARKSERELSKKELMAQLSFLLPPFMDKVADRDILACASRIAEKYNLPNTPETRFTITTLAFSNMKRYWRRRGWRKMCRNFRTARKKEGYAFTACCTPLHLTETADDFFRNPYEFTKRYRCTKLKDSRHTLCIRIQPVQSYESYFLKAYRSSGHMKSLSYLIRKSRTRTAWEKSWQLMMRGIPTPKPLYALSGANPWRPVYGIIIYPWIEDAARKDMSIHNALAKWGEDSLITRLTRFLWNMHERGICHGDCKITNFAIKEDMSMEVFDLDSTIISKDVDDNRRLKDLAALCVSLQKRTGSGDITQKTINAYARYHVPWRIRKECLRKRLAELSARKQRKQKQKRGKQ
jgi:tRNA A-37 threonylcarbamoyl transferase component Bud32